MWLTVVARPVQLSLGRGGLGGVVVSELDCGVKSRRFASKSHLKLTTLTFPPVVHDWLIKDPDMSSRISATI